MSIGSIYTLGQAADMTGAHRNLVTFLVRERQIPVRKIGLAKVLDEHGLKLLQEAIADFNAKSEATAV